MKYVWNIQSQGPPVIRPHRKTGLAVLLVALLITAVFLASCLVVPGLDPTPILPPTSTDSPISLNFNILDPMNDSPWGLWSDGTTMWVSDTDAGKLFAYVLETKTRDSSKDIFLSTVNDEPRGIWSHDTTMWVVNDSDTAGADKLLAYNMATGNPDTTRDITLSTENAAPRGLWANADGTTIWVSDLNVDSIFAYHLVDDMYWAPDPDNSLRDLPPNLLNFESNSPRGIWGNLTAIWTVVTFVLDTTYIAIYNLSDGEELLEHAIPVLTLDDNSNGSPRGLWSNGTTLWVVDNSDAKIYAYNLSSKDATP